MSIDKEPHDPSKSSECHRAKARRSQRGWRTARRPGQWTGLGQGGEDGPDLGKRTFPADDNERFACLDTPKESGRVTLDVLHTDGAHQCIIARCTRTMEHFDFALFGPEPQSRRQCRQLTVEHSSRRENPKSLRAGACPPRRMPYSFPRNLLFEVEALLGLFPRDQGLAGVLFDGILKI